MSSYELANGATLTDEDIERIALEFENESWEGMLSGFHVGRPRLSEGGRGEESITVPVKFPASMVAQIDMMTENRSDFIRRSVAVCLRAAHSV